jgi:hypothetical protein
LASFSASFLAWTKQTTVENSVADPDPNPDPPDPHVFGPPGSGSAKKRYGSGSGSGSGCGSGSFYHHAKIVGKTLIPTIFVTLFDFLSSTLVENGNRSGSVSISQRYGSRSGSLYHQVI